MEGLLFVYLMFGMWTLVFLSIGLVALACIRRSKKVLFAAILVSLPNALFVFFDDFEPYIYLLLMWFIFQLILYGTLSIRGRVSWRQVIENPLFQFVFVLAYALMFYEMLTIFYSSVIMWIWLIIVSIASFCFLWRNWFFVLLSNFISLVGVVPLWWHFMGYTVQDYHDISVGWPLVIVYFVICVTLLQILIVSLRNRMTSQLRRFSRSDHYE